MKTVLTTGTDGFIGGRFLEKTTSTFHHIKIEVDFLNRLDWKTELKNLFANNYIEGVFHFGACSDTLNTDVNYMMLLNYEFTRVLVDSCKIYNIPIIYSSSAANYGIDGKLPSNLYGWSKYIAENYVNLNGGVSLRYFNVYGPGEEKKGKMASVAYQMYSKHKMGDTIQLFPKKPMRDFIYVDDVISANLKAYESYDSISGRYYDVGVGESRPFEDVLTIMDISYEYTSENSIPTGYQFYTCSSKDMWIPEWKPVFNLEDGLGDYLSHLKVDKQTNLTYIISKT